MYVPTTGTTLFIVIVIVIIIVVVIIIIFYKQGPRLHGLPHFQGIILSIEIKPDKDRGKQACGPHSCVGGLDGWRRRSLVEGWWDGIIVRHHSKPVLGRGTFSAGNGFETTSWWSWNGLASKGGRSYGSLLLMFW
jgi:hypothetical protein